MRKGFHTRGYVSTYLPLVPLICASELGHYWFRWRRVACSMPSHYMNQYWLIINWIHRNKLQWHSNQNTKRFVHENAFENADWKWRPCCFGLSVLITAQTEPWRLRSVFMHTIRSLLDAIDIGSIALLTFGIKHNFVLNFFITEKLMTYLSYPETHESIKAKCNNTARTIRMHLCTRIWHSPSEPSCTLFSL